MPQVIKVDEAALDAASAQLQKQLGKKEISKQVISISIASAFLVLAGVAHFTWVLRGWFTETNNGIAANKKESSETADALNRKIDAKADELLKAINGIAKASWTVQYEAQSWSELRELNQDKNLRVPDPYAIKKKLTE